VKSVQCPKCGASQPDSDECIRCGVIVSKARQGPPPDRPAVPVGPSPLLGAKAPRLPTPRGRGVRPVVLLAALAAVAAGAVWALSRPPAKAPAPPDGAAVAAADRPGAAPSLRGDSAGESFVLPFASEPPSVQRVSRIWHEGASGWDRAVEENRETGTPIALYFRVGWCPYCRHLEQLVLPAPPVIPTLRRVIKVQVDPERSAWERRFARRFSIKGYPTLWLLPGPDEKGRRVATGGRPSAGQFAGELESQIDALVRDLIDRGHRSLNDGKPDRALALLTQAIQNDPDNPRAWFYRGKCYAEQRAFEPAVADLLRVLELEPGDTGTHDFLGHCCLEVGRYDLAVEYLSRLIELDRRYDGGRAYYLRSAAYHRLGERESALEDARRACNLGHRQGCAQASGG